MKQLPGESRLFAHIKVPSGLYLATNMPTVPLVPGRVVLVPAISIDAE